MYVQHYHTPLLKCIQNHNDNPLYIDLMKRIIQPVALAVNSNFHCKSQSDLPSSCTTNEPTALLFILEFIVSHYSSYHPLLIMLINCLPKLFSTQCTSGLYSTQLGALCRFLQTLSSSSCFWRVGLAGEREKFFHDFAHSSRYVLDTWIDPNSYGHDTCM